MRKSQIVVTLENDEEKTREESQVAEASEDLGWVHVRRTVKITGPGSCQRIRMLLKITKPANDIVLKQVIRIRFLC